VAIRSPINPQSIVKERSTSAPAAMNFISGGSPMGSSIVSSAANKIVGFQRGAASVAPKVPDLGSIIKTLSSNILTNVENKVQSINQNVTNIVNQSLKTFGQDYQNRLKQIDDAKPNNILSNFLKLYQQAIGYIQFLGNRKNVKTLGDNLQSLQRIFAETFEVAKIIRQTIVKIVKQLSNLPTASTGGGGLNLDVNVPGGPLKRSAPRGITRMLKMAGTGAAIAGAGALGAKVVSGMMDSGGEVQTVPGSGSEGLSGPILDRFNAILERFDAAISSMTKKPAAAPSAPVSGGSGAAASETPSPSAPPASSPGGATATGSEQQKTEALIAGEEGVRLNAYQNPGDVPTIGYGQTRINGRPVKLGDKMTKEEATVGLRSNIESHRAVAIRNIGQNSWNNIKDENAKAVLSSLAYNYGHVPPSVVVAAKTGDSKKIAAAVRELTNPRNPSYDSRLIGRRTREADFISTGVIQKADKDFLPGGKLASPGVASSTTVAATPAKPGVTAAPTPASTAQQIAQTVAQPAQQKPQVTVLPMAMNAGSTPPPPKPTSSGGSPAPNMTGGRTLPSLSSTNHDNFLTLYSKMVYNIVDG
jgi:GH24 family phage-related lysozyme (muramidase)